GWRRAEPCRAELAPLPVHKPSPAVAGRPLRVSKGGGGGRRPTPGDMERKGLPATAGPFRPLRSEGAELLAQTAPPGREKNKKKAPGKTPAPFLQPGRAVTACAP